MVRKYDCAFTAQYPKHSNAQGVSLGWACIRARIKVRVMVNNLVGAMVRVRVWLKL